MRWLLTYRFPARDLADPHTRVCALDARVVEAPTPGAARIEAARAEIGPNGSRWLDNLLTLCVPYPEELDDPEPALARPYPPPPPGRAITPVRGHRDAISPPPRPRAAAIAQVDPPRAPPASPPPIVGLGREAELTAAARATHQHPFLRFGQTLPELPPGPDDPPELPPPARRALPPPRRKP